MNFVKTLPFVPAVILAMTTSALGQDTPPPPVPKGYLTAVGGAVQLLNAQGEKMALSRGETVYTDAEDGDLTLVGTGEVAQIYLPGPGTPDSELKDLVGHRPVRAIP